MRYTGQFKRDVNLAKKRGKDMDKLRHVISLLLAGNPSRVNLATTR